ncbi:MAG: biosynthetic arginine decarboxylase [Longimicrobiales bacterium]|nr:biosynthetic arginine decarboxylase [Longimicrobiales bacterium]
MTETSTTQHTTLDHQSSDASWSPADAAALYGIDHWGAGYFGISDAGTVEAYPDGDRSRAIDLAEVMHGLAGREIGTPLILRLPGILGHRMRHLRRAFDAAIADGEYEGGYACVYPIKVNQERHICEAIRDFGAELGFGLEVGSKPELIAGLGLTQGFDDMPLVCNGFKDTEYIETVVLAAKMGRNIIPVVEQAHELRLIAESADRHDTLPDFGIRAKLATSGVGRWASSAGFRGKFGLTVGEILHAVDYLRKEELLGGLKMLHCHVGSQIFDIRTVKYVVSELAHLYVEVVRAGAPVEILDLGGGLGIDYDGTRSASDSSINYTLEQYAADIVYRVKTVCDEAGVPHPDLMTESGRALVAHSSVLVCEVIGSRRFQAEPDEATIEAALESDDPPQPLLDLHDAFLRRSSTNDQELLEIYADAAHALAEAADLFSLGYMDLRSRAACEELYWAVGTAALEHFGDDLPEAIADLPDRLADLYFVNLSVFQSLLDSWGIGQLFPVMPLHRLDEEPTRHGVLADITCDSDGRIDRFPGEYGPKTTLELHAAADGSDFTQNGESPPYYLGIFLTGAYQETLGDLHNLLGDTNAVHVTLGEDGRWRIDSVVEGDSVREVLHYVQFDPDEIRSRLHQNVEAALETERLTLSEAASLRRFLDESLQGYTYLE